MSVGDRGPNEFEQVFRDEYERVFRATAAIIRWTRVCSFGRPRGRCCAATSSMTQRGVRHSVVPALLAIDSLSALGPFCASRLLAEGAPFTAVAGYLGDTVETVGRIYVRCAAGRPRRARGAARPRAQSCR